MIYPQQGPKNGAIYSPTMYRSMFEGRRASNVGDILTVIITENTAADKNETGNASKKGSVTIASTDLSGNSTVPTLSTSSNTSSQDSGDANNKNSFTGNISVTVVEVRPNGNLVVTGEKQVAFDQGVEFIRVSGVVNPYMITNDNTVSSNTIADARLEYRTNSTFDLANLAKRLNRFFLSALPI
jgi:flagellar L-ring protein precursor FlgH